MSRETFEMRDQFFFGALVVGAREFFATLCCQRQQYLHQIHSYAYLRNGVGIQNLARFQRKRGRSPLRCHRFAAGNRQYLAGDVAGVCFGRKEYKSRRHFFRLARTLHRVIGAMLRDLFGRF